MTGKTFTVLVVDDEMNIRLGAERILRGSGFEVLMAESGEQGLETLAEHECHIMLLDLMMPGIGGMEVLKKVQVDHPELVVIVITGFATLETAVSAMKQGAYDFVPKPFQPDQLRIVVFRAADTLRLKEEHKRLAEEQLKTLKHIDEEKSRTRAVIEAMTEGVVVTDRDGDVVLYNHAATELIGHEEAPEVGGSLEGFIGDAALREVILKVCAETDEECSPVTTELDLDDDRWLLAKVTPITTEWAGNAGALTVLTDITALKELDRLKSEFVAKVSHELRSPLASINQQLAVVLYDLLGEAQSEQRQRITRVRERTKGLLGMISDLLDISRIESGDMSPQRDRTDVLAILEKGVEHTRPAAEGKGLTLEVSLATGPVEMECDAREIDSVFVNLVANAINYTPEGGTVKVSAEVDGEELVVQVADTGIGIDEGHCERIFDKFYRVKSPETRYVVGSGLGLPIVKGIVASYEGTVSVESTPGEGATFTVRLPLRSE